MKKTVLRWELGGILFTILLGSLLHFVFDWSGQWSPLAVVAAVNESVWEHLKLGFWPALFFFFVEYPFIRKPAQNVFFAKGIGILLIPALIAVLFYSYTAFMESILPVDLAIFVIAVVVGQLTSYGVLTARALPSWVNIPGLLLLLGLGIAFSTLTYYPPELPLFQDPVTGGYGIP
ncbi:MAG: hypothetical protein IBX68_10080 [Dehalococcoidia bacterium]|nr:hypothetical protein [Dehalococcoidia bacterium]